MIDFRPTHNLPPPSPHFTFHASLFTLLRDSLVALAWPRSCRLCDRPVESWDDGVACGQCWEETAVTRLFGGQPVCLKCGLPVAGGAPSCLTCDDLPFAAARACGVYQGALTASIFFLKSRPHVCPRLRRLLIRTCAEHGAALRGDVLIPVPLHPERRRERGFNQAALIARVISRQFRMPLDEGALVRVKNTQRHRVGMDAVERARSVNRAFAVTRRGRVRGAGVLLVDDVFTTGSTLGEATRTLLDAGAARVSVLTVARVVHPARLPPEWTET